MKYFQIWNNADINLTEKQKQSHINLLRMGIETLLFLE